MSRLVVIGGGLAGLTAALRASPAQAVTVLEAGSRLGGQIHTVREQGFVIERGAEGFVFRSEAVPALARDAGLAESELIAQSVLDSYGFDGDRLALLRPGEAATLLGFQVAREELGKGIRTLRGGMGSLIDALHARLAGQAAIELGAEVSAIEAANNGGGLDVVRANGERLRADAVIVAVPAVRAAQLLPGLAGEAAAALANAPTSSSVTVELAYPRDAIAHPLDGSGFVVAEAAQQNGLRACTFSSAKFVGRAAEGKVSLRVFFRPSAPDLAALDDAAWVARAEAGLGRVLELRGAPLASWVSRWPSALPIFNDTHRAAVAALEAALAPYPIALAGSAFHGSGIDAAVRSGERAARALSGESPTR